jgi:cystathionine beta-synthase
VHTIAPNAPISDLLPIFQRDHVAIVADPAAGGRFVGLITKIDLLNYLRQQLV